MRGTPAKMPTIRYLADVSAIIRLARPEVAGVLIPLIDAGTVATCGITALQLLARLNDPAMLPSVASIHAASVSWLAMEDSDLKRALEVQALLVKEGQQRAYWPDLVVAAIAERHGVTVLHCSGSYETIGKVTVRLLNGRRCPHQYYLRRLQASLVSYAILSNTGVQRARHTGP